MKYQVDQWVLYDPFADNPILTNPKKVLIVYVFEKNEHYFYEYEIYIDETPGYFLKVRESDLYPTDD